MTRPPRPTAAALAAAALLAPLSAQVQSRGVLAGGPAAVLVDGGLAPGTDARTHVHRNGFGTPATTLPPVLGAADLQAIFAFYGAPPTIDVDDFSTGRDDVLFDGMGVMQVPPVSWGVISFSLRDGAVGIPGSRIAQQAAEGDLGAALFSWIMPGSAVPPQLIGRTERSHSVKDLGLDSPDPVEVDGLDVPQAIYFTVSHATRGDVPASWWLWAGGATLPSGATILRTLKTSHASAWSPPHVFVPYTQLGLGQNEDIDALAYDDVRQKLLLSTVGTARDQLLVFDLGSDGGAGMAMLQDAKLPDGVSKVSEHIGKAENDDVDAVCTLDPQIRTVGSPAPEGDDFGSSCGSPRQGLLGVPQVHASAHRRRAGAQTFYDTWLMGWPPVTGEGPGLAALFLTFDPDLTLHPYSIQLRDPLAPVPGDPRQYSLLVPPALELTGFSFTFRWVALDLAVTEIAEAWPLQVFL